MTDTDTTGILFDNRLLRHTVDAQSPENPERLRSLNQRLEQKPYRDRFRRIAAQPASIEAIERVHTRFYLDQIRTHARGGDPFAYDRDTYLMAETLGSAVLAAGGCIQLAEAIVSGVVKRGFALVRPPGHHAEAGRGMGFCVVNNAAVTANWLRAHYGFTRILIFDFDVHHGNGTQEIFYDRGDVLVISFHQKDLFPFSGRAEEIGEAQGRGYTLNIPVFPQYGDGEYTYLAGTVLRAVVEQYLPQIILVSAGFDGHRDDPISKTDLSSAWFGTITTLLRQLADEVCEGRLLMLLEGGYNPLALEDAILAVLESLALNTPHRVGILHSPRAAKLIAAHPVKNFWTF
jgi:acetoin utilization deacetylase AcuC-like enzyme